MVNYKGKFNIHWTDLRPDPEDPCIDCCEVYAECESGRCRQCEAAANDW